MSIIPEILLQTAIVRGIHSFRRDRRFIDQLFRNLDQKSLQQMHNLIRQEIDISFNYPRGESLKVPAIIILLKSESESQAYLGDSMGLGQPDEFSYLGGIDEETVGGVASTASLTGEGRITYGPILNFGGTGTASTITLQDAKLVPDRFSGRKLTINFVGGTGEGQIREILSNTSDTITIKGTWNPIPDDTTIFVIKEPIDEIVGQPTKIYDRVNDTPFIERKGSLYKTNFQIQVIGSTQESAIYLYAILKSIFTLFRLFLEGQGIINLQMSGTDFVPRTEYQPDFAYMRALNLEFVVPFDTYENVDPLVDAINLIVEAGDTVAVDPTDLAIPAAS